MTQTQERTNLRLSLPELHTVLAALRYYQAHGQADFYNRPTWVNEIATDCGSLRVALDENGIDRLCERLNTEP